MKPGKLYPVSSSMVSKVFKRKASENSSKSSEQPVEKKDEVDEQFMRYLRSQQKVAFELAD